MGNQSNNMFKSILAGLAVLAVVHASPIRAVVEDSTLDSNVTIHKLNWPASGQCGEVSMPAKSAGFPEKFGGFAAGSCSEAGYTTSAGTKHECSPKVMGKQWCQDVAIFTKGSPTY